jgi:hypothetical protein
VGGLNNGGAFFRQIHWQIALSVSEVNFHSINTMQSARQRSTKIFGVENGKKCGWFIRRSAAQESFSYSWLRLVGKDENQNGGKSIGL